MRKITIAVVLLASIGINYYWQSKVFYQGDAYSTKISAQYFVRSGDLGIPFERSNLIPTSFLKDKNQYFFENNQRQRFYSRWGSFNLILSSIPAFFSSNESLLVDDKTVAAHNVFQIVLAALLVFYLLKITYLYTEKNVLAGFFVLSSVYSTLVWYYIRAQTYEVPQLLFFSAFYFHFVTFWRKRLSLHSVLALIFITLLCLLKSVYFIEFSLVLLFYIIQFRKKEFEKKDVLIAASFFTFALGVQLFDNLYIFNELLYKGAGVARPEEQNLPASWSLTHLSGRLYDYFYHPRYNLFRYYPFLITTVFGWKKFCKNKIFKREMYFVAAMVLSLLMILMTFHTVGEWTYGPRFWLTCFFVFSIPSLAFFDKLFYQKRKLKDRFALVAIVLLLAFTTREQIIVNGHRFFMMHMIEGYFSQFKIPRVNDYFYYNSHATIISDFKTHIEKNADYLPVKEIFNRLGTEANRQLFLTEFKNYIQEISLWDSPTTQ